jgi:4,5-dihydroxyphthalate decarboxylase
MATDLEIQIPWLRYDITMPLIEGRVPIEGVKLVPNRAAPNGTVFGQDSPHKTGDFGLVDLNMANWMPAIEAGWELVGLPVFPKRKHLYTYLFCRADSGIATPKDLEGRRVLSSITSSAVGIWWHYLLEKRHGVDLSRITWVSPREQWPIHGWRWKMEPLAGRKSALEVLVDGDAEAVMVDISDRKLSHALENDPRIMRLFPDYLGEAKRFHEESGILPPVHMIVMSRKLDRDFPELAGKLVAAFDQAKQLGYGDILDDRSGLGLIDLRERFLAQQGAWGDPFPHGLAANRRALDIFITHCREHGLVKNDLGYEKLLAASTLAT